ncbi:Predicted ATP-dependent carboligase, ATP-grasp superfamily [Nonomuraea wenchangensis]|uniref:Predicted ATP-dependent carboligase, ATP-grasp superfamily n=1 Tax=Nonomuraea wenchangensis TaxID=568860 RepID=A0A1I0BWL0_9ACTN|nr:Predicted ATP-dependent carboligase, ATP-grasp superfamily [Nonomuraea wenchangensis]
MSKGTWTAVRALIVETGFSRGALAAVRSLAAAGWEVGVGAPTGAGLASSSRFRRRRHLVPAAHEDRDAFLAAVRRAVRDHRYDVVFGAGEAEVLALSLLRDEVGAIVPHAGHRQVVRAIDKQELSEAAGSVGFLTARALDPSALAGERPPLVVKSRLHAHPERPGAPPRIDTLVVSGAEAARRRVDEVRRLGGEPRVEEFHEGRLMAYSAVTAPGGRVVCDCMQVASRIWPPGAGASCRAETVRVDAAISDRAARLLAALGWFGLAQLQFVVPEDGRPRLIDLNGRFYGSMALATAAGANLPAAWAALAVGHDVPPTRARPGVRYHWLEGDLRRAAVERRSGLLLDLAGTLRYAVGAVHSTLSLRDPAPALARIRASLTRSRRG